MRVLLINPNDMEPNISPVGLEYVAEHLIQNGHDVTVKNEIIYDNWDLVGISIRNIDNTSMHPPEFLVPKIQKLVRDSKSYGIGPVVIGGTGVNLLPEQLLEFTGADYAVVQKGFGAIDRLLSAIERQENVERIIRAEDLVQGRFNRNLVDHSEFDTVGVMTKAGCPYDCTYCDYTVADGSKNLRTRNVDDLVYEIQSLVDQGHNRIFFADANFNVPASHAAELLNILTEKEIDIKWQGFSNPKHCTDEYLKAVYESGKRTLSFGVDTLSDNILKAFNKPFSYEDIFSAMQRTKEFGIEYSFPLLFGHPDETIEDIEQAFERIDALEPKYANVVVGIRLFPGTKLHRYCVEKEHIAPDQDLLEPFYLPVPDENMELIERKMKERAEICIPNDAQHAFVMYED